MFYSILLNRKHPFYDENERTFRILFANDDKRTKLLDETRNEKKKQIIYFFTVYLIKYWYINQSLEKK